MSGPNSAKHQRVRPHFSSDRGWEPHPQGFTICSGADTGSDVGSDTGGEVGAGTGAGAGGGAAGATVGWVAAVACF